MVGNIKKWESEQACGPIVPFSESRCFCTQVCSYAGLRVRTKGGFKGGFVLSYATSCVLRAECTCSQLSDLMLLSVVAGDKELWEGAQKNQNTTVILLKTSW